MQTLLIRNADMLVTMDAQRREIRGGSVFIRDNVIEAVGIAADLPSTADETLDASGQIVIPGLINTHHHMYQSLTRATAQDSELFSWLQTLYPLWANLTPEMIRVSTQTAMAENDKDIAYTREKFNCTPAEYAEELGWTGPDAWHAHCVKLDDEGIHLFARTGTGVVHCPCPNMRLASGIAPIRKMIDAGVNVSIGVDGSASNDGAHMLGEARMAMLLQRVAHGPVQGPSAMSARQALELATLGGARVLNRDDIGAIAPGMSADIVTFPLDTIGMAGALHDPVAALMFCSVPKVQHNIVNGKVVVRDGELTTLEMPVLVETHNALARALAEAAHGAR